MKKLVISVVLIAAVCLSGKFCHADETDHRELELFKNIFAETIGNSANFDQKYIQVTKNHILFRISKKPDFSGSQYFIYVDRNPKEQNIYICFYDADKKDVIFIGGAKTSTGNGNWQWKQKGRFF